MSTTSEETPRAAAALSWLPLATIVVANLVPLYGVLIAGWEMLPLAVLIWSDFAVRLLITTLHVALICPKAIEKVAGSYIGLLTAWVLVQIFRGDAGTGRVANTGDLLDLAEDMLPQILSVATILCLPFIVDVLSGRYRRADAYVLANTQTGRLLVLVLTVIFGGFLSALLGSPTWALVVLVLLKAALEIGIHEDPTAGSVR